MRADKFLWSVRLYKTRGLASEACKTGKVIINNIEAKPSKTVSKGEILIVKKSPVTYTYRVIDLVASRVAGKLTAQFIEDLTPKEELAKLDIVRLERTGYREKGTGRPTKKDRRELDKRREQF